MEIIIICLAEYGLFNIGPYLHLCSFSKSFKHILKPFKRFKN